MVGGVVVFAHSRHHAKLPDFLRSCGPHLAFDHPNPVGKIGGGIGSIFGLFFRRTFPTYAKACFAACRDGPEHVRLCFAACKDEPDHVGLCFAACRDEPDHVRLCYAACKDGPEHVGLCYAACKDGPDHVRL